MKFTTFLKQCVLGAAAISTAAFAQTSDFPNRPITLMVGFAAGGNQDVWARVLAARMAEHLKQPVVVVNRVGAGGTIMLSQLAKAAPDGYTLGALSGSTLLFSPRLQKVDYQIGDFTYLAGAASQPFCICGAKASPLKTIEAVRQYARQNPGKLTYGHSGLGHTTHVFTETAFRAIGISANGIPYKGDIEVINSLVGNHIDMGALSSTFVPYAKDGRIVPLVMVSDNRLRDFPGVPTIREAGSTFDTRLLSLIGYGAPKGLSADVQRKLESALEHAIRSPEYAKALEANFSEVVFRDSSTFSKEVAELEPVVAKMIKDVGL